VTSLQFILSAVLLGHIARGILSAFKDIKINSMIFLSVIAATLLTIVGIDSGRAILSYGILSIAVFQLLFFSKGIVLTRNNSWGILLLSVFLMVFLISYLYSPAISSEYGIWKFIQIVCFLYIPALLILLVGKFKNQEIEQIENFTIIVCVLASLMILMNFILSGGINSLESSWFQRQSAGEANPIWLSRFLSLGILVLQSTRFQKRPYIVFLLSAVLFIAALMTGSKTVLFFTIPCIILYKLSNGTLSKNLIRNLFFVGAIVAFVWMFLHFTNSDAIIKRFTLQSNTVDEREIMYHTSLNSYLNSDNLIFGNGAATIGESLGFNYVREYPHNLALELLYEIGLFGLFVFLLQFIFALVLYFKGLKNWIFFAYVLHLLFSLTSGDLAANNLIFVFFAFYVISKPEYKHVDQYQSIKQKRKRRIVWS
jgi:O-Antigen ligase